MPVNKYEGVCQGGPHAGKNLAHLASRKEYLECITAGEPPMYPSMSDERELKAREIGTYFYSSAGGGCWIWEPANG